MILKVIHSVPTYLKKWASFGPCCIRTLLQYVTEKSLTQIPLANCISLLH